MKIAIGTDHAGYRYKERIKEFVIDCGHQVEDFGTHSEEPVDYPVFIRPAAESVSKGGSDRGIVLGGSGNGEAMVANRVKGIRCALCWNAETATLARLHNDSNVLSIGARLITLEQALDIVRKWLETPFEGGRHIKRIAMIDEAESMVSGAPDRKSTPGGLLDEKGGNKAVSRDAYEVTISFGYILYSEGKKTIELKVDPGLKKPSVINIPSLTRWNDEMPEWCKGRRDEILERIKPKCVHLKCEWKEF
jgi:ribose 5-phosphate isomerase B